MHVRFWIVGGFVELVWLEMGVVVGRCDVVWGRRGFGRCIWSELGVDEIDMVKGKDALFEKHSFIQN